MRLGIDLHMTRLLEFWAGGRVGQSRGVTESLGGNLIRSATSLPLQLHNSTAMWESLPSSQNHPIDLTVLAQ